MWGLALFALVSLLVFAFTSSFALFGVGLLMGGCVRYLGGQPRRSTHRRRLQRPTDVPDASGLMLRAIRAEVYRGYNDLVRIRMDTADIHRRIEDAQRTIEELDETIAEFSRILSNISRMSTGMQELSARTNVAEVMATVEVQRFEVEHERLFALTREIHVLSTRSASLASDGTKLFRSTHRVVERGVELVEHALEDIDEALQKLSKTATDMADIQGGFVSLEETLSSSQTISRSVDHNPAALTPLLTEVVPSPSVVTEDLDGLTFDATWPNFAQRARTIHGRH